MLWLACAAAFARAPLPSLPVERPLQTPRGWTRVDLDRARDDGGGGFLGELRYGLSNRTELGLRLGLLTPFDAPLAPSDPRIRVRTSLWRREPPNRSVVVDVEATAPQSADEAPSAGIALAGAQQGGPFLLTLRGGVAGSSPTELAPIAEGQLWLQIGPLGASGGVRRDASAWVAAGGFGVQLSRALDVHGELGRALGGEGREGRLGVGVAF